MEHYMKFGTPRIHYSAISLSILIIFILSAIICKILQRGLNKDFLSILKNKIKSNKRRQERARIPKPEEDEASRLQRRKNKKPVDPEEVAWKKVHGDVFRTPAFPNILACFMGAGAQLVAMFFSILIAIIFAFANTLWRPYIYTTMMVILAIYGILNGYVTARTLKFFGTTDWNFSATVSSFALPVFITGAMLFELVFAWLARSPARYSAMQTAMRCIGWYLLNGVLCYIGAFRGYI